MGEFCRQKNTCCKLALRGRALRCFVQARRAARVEQKTKQSRTQTLRARDKLTTNTKHTKKSAGPQGTPTTHPSQAPNQQKQRRRQHQWQHQLQQHAAKETKCIHGGATAANRLAGRLKQARKRTNPNFTSALALIGGRRLLFRTKVMMLEAIPVDPSKGGRSSTYSTTTNVDRESKGRRS